MEIKKIGSELFEYLELFLFDMDGLLFDTESIYCEMGKNIAKRNGYEFTEEFITKCTGLPNDSLKKLYFKEFGEQFPYEEHWAEIKKYVHELALDGEIPLKKGAIEILNFLSENNKKIVLGTSSSFETAKKLLDSKKITQYFHFLVTANDVKNGKPNPEVFLKGAEKSNVDPLKSMVFEDSFNGIKAAHAAKMYPVMIPDRLKPTEEIEKILFAKYDNLLEVIDYFKEN